MGSGAISTTRRRTIHPAVQSILAQTPPRRSLRRALTPHAATAPRILLFPTGRRFRTLTGRRFRALRWSPISRSPLVADFALSAGRRYHGVVMSPLVDGLPVLSGGGFVPAAVAL